MSGDFSRGYEPDRKRGRTYRRVLLQQGRPVLDSDFAATVDAVLWETRTAARLLGCAVGSSNLGYLVTPGRLLALFAEAHGGLVVAAGAPDVWLDYRYRFVDRYPALHVGSSSEASTITVPLLQGMDSGATRLALWARVETPTTINVAGVAIALQPGSPDVPQRVVFTPGAVVQNVVVDVAAGDEVWLYLLEQDDTAGSAPAFWIAPGTYEVDGLVVDADGGPFPEVAFPVAAGFPWDASPPTEPLAGLLAPTGLASGARLVAYLEVWEREISAVEDPGIREEALGTTDTSVRTQLLGQVKIATLNGTLPTWTADATRAIRAAFADVEVSGGELTIEVPPTTPTTDPCALPESAGYSGSDNRLYRVEVHRGGGLSQVLLKWSRDNGSELFAATVDVNGNLVFDAGTPLGGGDIVEVLSDVVDLGDDIGASVSAGGFEPAQRAVGQLAQLVALDVSSSPDEVAFRLADVDDAGTAVTLDDRYGTATHKVRRWHGIVDPQGAAGTGAAQPGPHVLEDGISIELSSTGSYRPGQWWQYEARVVGANANGPWRPKPHGPERLFAPLALLEYDGGSEPLRLLAWLDTRFSDLCDIDADDVSFAGRRVSTDSDTVQEALEELYGRLPSLRPWPHVEAGGISWRNDRTLPFPGFQAGLAVTFSEEMHPATATLDTFVVSLEVPTDDDPPDQFRRPLIVDGRIDVSGRTWTFVPRNVDSASVGRWVRDLGGPVRCRVRLASGFILDQTQRPLDGDVVGAIAHDGYDDFVDLLLPSGDGMRGGDFESWFYLTGPAPLVTIEHVNPADGVKFAPNTGPRTVLLAFSGNVRFGSITPQSLTVSVRPPGQNETSGDGVAIPGSIEPYPFETQPGVVSRVTFTPENPDALRPAQGDAGTWVYTVRVSGTGENPIVDLDDRPIDGAGTGEASDFVSRFSVEVAPPT